MNGDDAKNVASLAEQLEKLVAANEGKNLRAYIVDVSDKANKAELEKLVADKNLSKIGVAYIQGAPRDKVMRDWELNPAAKNTVLYSKNREVLFNAVNLLAKDFSKLEEAVKKSLAE
ncbi:MAG: hypothetical protein NZT92_03915 [Abditibacteriales bacterium]|nr:hypothetical protein [Abditibacteriales bacterium]MDW8364333.1 hypothetical protein [Abditibacteriales bacterium]